MRDKKITDPERIESAIGRFGRIRPNIRQEQLRNGRCAFFAIQGDEVVNITAHLCILIGHPFNEEMHDCKAINSYSVERTLSQKAGRIFFVRTF